MGACATVDHAGKASRWECFKLAFANAAHWKTGPRGSLWQDRHIRWDLSSATLSMRKGEWVLSRWSNIEDTKAENGLGDVTVTNLRMIWIGSTNSKLNISIGLGTITYIHFNMVTSPTFGRVRAPHIVTLWENTRFEFMFAARADVSTALFTTLDSAHRRYLATRVFRDLILREEASAANGLAVIRYGETLLYRVHHCDNIATGERYSGSLYITDKRVAWGSSRPNSVNVSIPYVQLRSLRMYISSFGKTIVIETAASTGHYILGFTSSDRQALRKAYCILKQAWHSQKQTPFYGPLDGTVQYQGDQLVMTAPSDTRQSTVRPSDTENNTANELLTASTDESIQGSNLHFEELQQTSRSLKLLDSSSTAGMTLPGVKASVLSSDRFEELHPGQSAIEASKQDALSITTSTAEQLLPCGLTQSTTASTADTGSSSESSIGSVSFLVTEAPSHGKGPELDLGRSRSPSGFRLPLISPVDALVRTKDAKAKFLTSTSEPQLLSFKGSTVDVSLSKSHSEHTKNLTKEFSDVPCESSGSTVIENPGNLSPRCCVMGSLMPNGGTSTCIVCMTYSTEAAFDPCGHLCACLRCAAKLQHCPICRADVLKVLRVYLQAA